MIIITSEQGNFNIRKDTDEPTHVFSIQPDGTIIGYKGNPVRNFPKGFSKNSLLDALNEIEDEYLTRQQKALFFSILHSNLSANQFQMLERMVNAGCTNFRVNRSSHVTETDLANFRTYLHLAREYERQHPNTEYYMSTLKAFEQNLKFRNSPHIQTLLDYYSEEFVRFMWDYFYPKGYWTKVFKWLLDNSTLDYVLVIAPCQYGIASHLCEVFEQLINYANILHVKLENKNPYGQLFKLRKDMENLQDQIIDTTLQTHQDKAWEFEDDNFIAIVPTTYDELRTEGQQQHNCVGDYWTNHYGNELKKGKQNRGVVFIRKKNNPQKSFITCDFLLKDLKIKQYLATCNSPRVGTEAEEFKIKFQNHLNSLQ